MRSLKYLILALVASFMLIGCASKQNLAPKEQSEKTKLFELPTNGKAGIYIYRDSSFGGALTKVLYIDDKPIATSSPKMFFYREVEGDMEHKFSTQSEFSPNDLFLKTDKDKLYFIRQYIKMGVFAGGADLEVVDEAKAKEAILESDMELGLGH